MALTSWTIDEVIEEYDLYRITERYSQEEKNEIVVRAVTDYMMEKASVNAGGATLNHRALLLERVVKDMFGSSFIVSKIGGARV